VRGFHILRIVHRGANLAPRLRPVNRMNSVHILACYIVHLPRVMSVHG
jgi:hypothetical protein